MTMTWLPEAGWQRLDSRMLAVTPLRQLVGFLPVIAVVFVVGRPDLNGRFVGLLAGVAAVVLVGMLRWLTTRYRITSERVELRSGLLYRSARSVPRDRIRSVDLTAGPIHRLFGLSVVKIGTGEHATGGESRELTLDAVSAREADRLRQCLLDRLRSGDLPDTLPGAGAAGTPAVAGTPAAADRPNDTVTPDRQIRAGGRPPETELAALNWSWLRYAPLTVSSLAAVGAVAGAFAQFVGELGVEPSQVVEFGGVGAQLSAAPLWLGITIFAMVVLTVAVLGSVLIFVEAWWGFRLARESGGTLRVRRGLLTVRSVSLEERRLRGVELAEPLLMRVGRGARLTAVATGLGGGPGHGRDLLLPPAPVDETHRVAGLVLAEGPSSPTRTPLRGHPAAALRRRLVRAVLPTLGLAAAPGVASALGLATLPTWLSWVALGLLLPVAVLLAWDAYRSLGHGLTERYLVTRHGTGVRRTVALKRSGVIGWTVSRSLTQRFAGLVTLTATTAAGSGAYRVIDVGAADGLAFAEQAVPGLLSPFLDRDEVDAAVARQVTH